MTPILVLVFGVDPGTAVSSDLLASLVMKPVGATVHFRRGTVNWSLARWLVVGSVPAAFTGVFVLNDRGDYGRLAAATFEDEAKQIGLRIAGHDGWDRQRKSYVDLMTRIKATGADALYVAGDSDHNGTRLL